jgi:ketosteroid isomerase-like protein
MSVNKHKGFDALTPFFAMIEQALAGLADGDQFFDLFTDDVIFEYPYAFLGFSSRIEGRAQLISHFSGYGDILTLDRMGDLIVHRTLDDPPVIILEYSSHGRGVQTGKPYDNRYVSVITIRDRKIVHWRDYWNPQTVLDAIGGLEPLLKSMNAHA